LRGDSMSNCGAGGWRRAIAGALLALAAVLPLPAAAQDDAAVLERRVKGALLHRFLAYVEWPESAFARPDAPIVLGILGNETLAAELQAFEAGRTVEKRPVTVRRVRPSDSLRDVHLLFIDRSEAQHLDRLARGTTPTLVVTEWPGALEQGSIVNFTTVNDQVRFEISLDSARPRGLRLSSRLLSVAREVRGQ
jgi:hypothetical protein